MADRTTANLFAEIFKLLAQLKSGAPVDVDALATKFWILRLQGRYDFAPYQMEVDEELQKLGLAQTINAANGDEVVVYLGDSSFKE